MAPSSASVNGGGSGSVRKRTEAPPPTEGRKYRSMEEIMLTAKPADLVNIDFYADVMCQLCRDGDREDEMLLCDWCDLGYHLFCLRPIVVRVPSGPWLCPSCSNDKPLRRFPLMQTKIVDFFRIQKCTEGAADGKCGSSSQGEGLDLDEFNNIFIIERNR